MSKASASPSPSQHMGHKLAAAGISASVAVLFLVLALPLGRSSRPASEAAKNTKPVLENNAARDEDPVLAAIEDLARTGREEPAGVLQALEPLMQLLLQKAPAETKQAVERWHLDAQAPTSAR